jgi:hypothetical protein
MILTGLDHANSKVKTVTRSVLSVGVTTLLHGAGGWREDLCRLGKLPLPVLSAFAPSLIMRQAVEPVQAPSRMPSAIVVWRM